MSILPAMPPQEGLHPLVVHFPIALLLTAPLFIAAGLLWPRHRSVMYVVATALLALGTAGAFAATMTGEWAEGAADQIAAAKPTLERHEELAELARNLFAGVTILSLLLAGAAWRLKDRMRVGAAWVAGVALLACHAGASIVLINASHEGGRLVHQFGVRAPVAAETATQGVPISRSRTEDDE